MNALQKRRAEQLTNIFENGTPVFQYSYVENLYDGRGYTCGRIGFCTGTGDCLEVVQRYTKRVPHNPLAKFIPELERLDSLPEDSPERGDVSKLTGFPQAWQLAAKDKLFCEVQDEVVDEWYFNPAMQHATQIGIKTALGQAIIYDTIIQHGEGTDPDGLPALTTRTKKKIGGTPKTGIDEKKWLLAFLDVRRADLLNPYNSDTQDVWAESVGRVDTLRKLIQSGNFDLHVPLIIEWEGEKFVLN